MTAPEDLADDPRWAALAAPFPPDQIELLPKPFSRDSDKGTCNRPDRNGVQCGGYHGLPAIHLSYVGHAGVTMRLNSVDPTWTWAPMYRDVPPELLQTAIATGNSEIVEQLIANAPMRYTDGGLWIHLTVLGVTRPGYGDAQGKSGPNAVKEIIGDAIRNGAMRFGVGTYLWSKSTAAEAMAIREHGADFDEPGGRVIGSGRAPDPPRQQATRPVATPTRRAEPPATEGVTGARNHAAADPPVPDDFPVLGNAAGLAGLGLTVHQAARAVATAAAACADLTLLRTAYRQVGKDALTADVLPVLSGAQADFTPLADGKPVPLGTWLQTCARHVEREGISVNASIRSDPTAPPAEEARSA